MSNPEQEPDFVPSETQPQSQPAAYTVPDQYAVSGKPLRPDQFQAPGHYTKSGERVNGPAGMNPAPMPNPAMPYAPNPYTVTAAQSPAMQMPYRQPTPYQSPLPPTPMPQQTANFTGPQQSANPAMPQQPYPAYPAYGCPSQPVPPMQSQPKKRNTGVIIAVSVVGGIAALVFVVFFVLAGFGIIADHSDGTSAAGRQGYDSVPFDDPYQMQRDISSITGSSCLWTDISGYSALGGGSESSSIPGLDGAYTCGDDEILLMFDTTGDTRQMVSTLERSLAQGDDTFDATVTDSLGDYAVLHDDTWMVIGKNADMKQLHDAWGGDLQRLDELADSGSRDTI
ncbi:hypothetical protein GFD17_01310 [Bifidobacterium sp. SMB2]|uniref:Uncharacterized protein n=1 Tax=Bifidobacterium saimiriisciurei TaxID=2661627 RepID=A0ABX0CGG1_9BIFI|nr:MULTISPECIES: hypothetical protein [Bifidobacterium]NEG95414.1 hypothetical protein [Bifidobacterium sp. SMB2]NEH11402.1 hypothetical protein [Bifidobacterium saimiriisciurei]